MRQGVNYTNNVIIDNSPRLLLFNKTVTYIAFKYIRGK